MTDLEYTLKFALEVLEENELENTKNKDNWIIGNAIHEQLRLGAVSGMFSSEKLEKAYKDGVRDALAKGYGTFNKENYY